MSPRNRELRYCGRHGHVTYAPAEPALAARLHADTPLGEAWRCLRCGDFALGAPAGSGPASEAPVPARGKALRQLVILRVLAVERIVRGLVLVAAAYGIHRFASAQRALRDSFGHLLPAARPLADRLGVDLDQNTLVKEATKALHAGQGTLNLVALGVLLYGLLEGTEGVGLWLAKRWGEYLTVVGTAAFLPLEVHELTKSVTATKVVTFLINVAAVVYLVWAKRLFGVRGGTGAYEQELRGQSLLEVEASAGEGGGLGSGRDVGMSDRQPTSAEAPHA
ncbi:uncharacterized membrane protein (DUF2068 family) [Motilibacter rhizosphaerae]|uniref:Uncharacterized membrane protein (DUF2068 family) n=1 Tax=Motilibacter rhizosphaerae TaxID=598652 RepID=A0A4Q7NXI8_9ACTN|nr:DUF2127 domain-containing protein [Motilibacter rhizosphaerae]RZS91112.1 uncharacterized membrane protein (DUF2068 family) [Motilibacter rhizosphaerae]